MLILKALFRLNLILKQSTQKTQKRRKKKNCFRNVNEFKQHLSSDRVKKDKGIISGFKLSRDLHQLLMFTRSRQRYNLALNNIGITVLAVDHPTVQKHAVDEITHWLTADTTLGKKRRDVISL